MDSSPSTTHDSEAAKLPLPQDGPEKAVLQVVDVQLDGTRPRLLEAFKLRPDMSKEEMVQKMKRLDTHESGTVRILELTIHSDFEITGLRDTKGPERTRPAKIALFEYLHDEYTPGTTKRFKERRILRWLNDPLLVNDIGSISKQWSQCFGSGTDGGTSFYRVVNRTSLQQDPLDLDVHPRDSYLTCARGADADDRLVVIIVNDVWDKQTFHLDPSQSKMEPIRFGNPRCISKVLDKTSWTSLSDGSVDTFIKMLLLDWFCASIYLQEVDYYEPLIWPELPDKKEYLAFPPAKNPHLQVPLGLFEPRLSAKSREAFQEIEDAEGILRSVNNLVDSIKFVLRALDRNVAADAFTQERRGRFGSDKQLLEGLYAERGGNANKALEALNRQLDYLTKRHAIREAKSIKLLTILASVYLPLSLAASLLGMQSSFKFIAKDARTPPIDTTGTNLLFDFFGVFLWLATSTIFLVQGIRFAFWLRLTGLADLAELLWLSRLSPHFRGPFSVFAYGKRWRFGGAAGRGFEMLRSLTKWWICAGFCVTLLVIFFVGMLRTAQKAWRAAWIVFAVYGGVGAVLIVGTVGLYGYLSRRLLPRRPKTAARNVS